MGERLNALVNRLNTHLVHLNMDNHNLVTVYMVPDPYFWESIQMLRDHCEARCHPRSIRGVFRYSVYRMILTEYVDPIVEAYQTWMNKIYVR